MSQRNDSSQVRAALCHEGHREEREREDRSKGGSCRPDCVASLDPFAPDHCGCSGSSGSHESSRSSGSSGPHESSRSSRSSGPHESSRSSGSSGPHESSRSSGSSGPHESSRSSGSSGPHESSRSSGYSRSHESSRSSGSSGPHESSRSSGSSGPHESSRSSGSSGPHESSRSSGSSGPDESSRSSGSSGPHEPSRSSGSSGPHESSGSSGSCESSGSSGSSRPSGPEGEGAHGGSAGPVEKPKEDTPLSCCSLADLKTLSKCGVELGPLTFSRTHAVLVDVDAFNRQSELVAQKGRDVWLSNFVKMPHSDASVITKTGLWGSNPVRRWAVISKHLGDLAGMKTASVADLEEAIMKYNPKYKGQWCFDALTDFVKQVPETDNYLHTLFPKIAALALKLPKYVPKAIPLLQRGQPASITLSQAQISCLLANAFFCTFPHRNTTNMNAEYHNYPSINFNSLFGNPSNRKREKLRAIMHYFKVMTDMGKKPHGLVTFERRVLKDVNISSWRNCQEKMPKLHVSSVGSIEAEGLGLLQVDFASRWIGGGVLDSGLVQEEILFLMNPELIVARLFTERLEENECLVITGSQQFSCHSGYSDSFVWLGPHEDDVQRDAWRRRQRRIVAIDALHFKYRQEQFNMRKVTRELNKAYCGFKAEGRHEPDIATGKWGCGAFNGDPQLKAVIQLMAAARARRGLAVFTFEDEVLTQELTHIHHLLVTGGTTVGKLFNLLEDFCAVPRGGDLFEFITNSLIARSQL